MITGKNISTSINSSTVKDFIYFKEKLKGKRRRTLLFLFQILLLKRLHSSTSIGQNLQPDNFKITNDWYNQPFKKSIDSRHYPTYTTLTFQFLSTSKLEVFKSLCTIGGFLRCKQFIPLTCRQILMKEPINLVYAKYTSGVQRERERDIQRQGPSSDAV